MLTENPLGILSVRFPSIDGQPRLAGVLEVNIPLLEGGLSYRGFLSPEESLYVTDLSAKVTKDVLDSARIVERSTFPDPSNNRSYTGYDVSLGEADSEAEVYTAWVHTPPEDPQQFLGAVDDTDFVYKDLRDPISFGVLVIVVGGIAAALCVFNQIMGRIVNKDCKKVEVTYGLGANFGEGSLGRFEVGCNVKCLE